MRRRISAILDMPSAGASIEVCGTAAVPPNRCDRFGPAFFQINEHLGSLVETPLRRFGHAELQNPNHAARDVLAGELQALHGFAKRLFHDWQLFGAAAAKRAIQKRQDLVAPAKPPVQLGGALFVRLAHFPPFSVLSVASFRACARFSSWIRS